MIRAKKIGKPVRADISGLGDGDWVVWIRKLARFGDDCAVGLNDGFDGSVLRINQRTPVARRASRDAWGRLPARKTNVPLFPLLQQKFGATMNAVNKIAWLDDLALIVFVAFLDGDTFLHSEVVGSSVIFPGFLLLGGHQRVNNEIDSTRQSANLGSANHENWASKETRAHVRRGIGF